MASLQYTQEELERLEINKKLITPELVESIRYDQISKGWSPEYAQSMDNINNATTHLVGDTKNLSPEKIAQYTPGVSDYVQKQWALSEQSNAGRMSAVIDLYESQVTENNRNADPANMARAELLSKTYGVTSEELNDPKVREMYNRAYDAGIIGKHIDKALQDARAMIYPGGGSMMLSLALQTTASWSLMRGELDTFLGIEKENRMLTSRFVSSGFRNANANITYLDAYIKNYSGKNPGFMASATAEKEASMMEAAALPAFSWDEGVASYAKGLWYKPFAQAGIFTYMGLPSLVGGVVSSTLLASGQPVAAGVARATGELVGFTVGAKIMAGSILYELQNLKLQDSQGNYAELDKDIILVTALISGSLESLIERQKIGAIAGQHSGALLIASMKMPLVKRTFGALAKSAGGSALAAGTIQWLGSTLEEMLEEGAQGTLRQLLTNAAIKMQKELRGSDIDWNYAGVGDYIETFRDEAMESFQSLFLLGAPSSVYVGVSKARDVKNNTRIGLMQSKFMADQYNNIKNKVETTKLSNLSPELLRDAVNQMTEKDGSPFTNGTVYVPAGAIQEAFAAVPNEVVRTKLLNDIGIETDSIIESSISGSDIALKMGDIAVMLKQHPDIRSAIENVMKPTPQGVAYSNIDSEMAKFEGRNKSVTRAMQIIVADMDKVDVSNMVYVAPEVIAPIIQTEESLNRVADELGVEPIILQQMVFDEKSDIPIKATRISEHAVSEETFNAIAGGVRTGEGNATLQELAAKRLGVRPDMDLVTRAKAAYRAEETMYGRLKNINVKEADARSVASILGEFFERQSVRVGINADEYRQRYGDIQFTSDKGKVYMLPGIVEPGAKGAISYGEKILISITPEANASTIIHEAMHFMLFDMERLHESIKNVEQKLDLQNSINALKKMAGWKKEQTQWTVPQLERVADAFVKYIAEGEAPSTGLKKAFNYLKKTLGTFYSHWFEKGEKLSDEVKNVFGNMLSIEMEAERLMEKHGITFSKEGLSLVKGLVTESELHIANNVEDAKAKVLSDMIKKYIERSQSDIKETKLYKDAYAKALSEVNQMRVYRYLTAAKDDIKLRMSKAQVKANVTRADFKKIPETAYSTKGIDIEYAALSAGYDSGQVLIDEIVRAPSAEQEAEARAMIAIMGSEADDSNISTQLEMLIDGTAESYHAAVSQLKPVWQALGMIPKQIAAETKYLTTVLQAAADEHVINMDSKLLPAKREAFIAAKARAQQEYKDAMKSENYTLAQQAATRVALNDALLRSSKAVIRNIVRDNKVVGRANKILNGKEANRRMDDHYVGLIEDIFINLGLRKNKTITIPDGTSKEILKIAGGSEGNRIVTLNDYIAQLASEGIDVPIAPWLLRPRQSEGSLTANEYRDIADALSFIIKDGRTQREQNNKNKKDSRAKAIEEAAIAMDKTWRKPDEDFKNNVNTPDKTGTSLANGLFYSLPRMESFVNVLDGLNNRMGKMWEMFYKPASDARDLEMLYSKRFGDVSTEIYRKLLPNAKAEKDFKSKKELFPQVYNISITRQELLYLVGLMGEREGRERTRWMIKHIGGVPDIAMVTDTHLNALANSVTTAEAQWINDMWSMHEDLGNMITAEHYKETGRNMRWIIKMPFKIVPKDSSTGVSVVMSGGYLPILYDKESVYSTAYRDRDLSSNEGWTGELTQNTAGQARFDKKTNIPGLSTPGYMKGRVSNVSYPVKIDGTAIAVHVQEVLHNITHRAPIREMMIRIKDPLIKQRIIKNFSFEMWNTMNTLITNLAGSQAEPITPIVKALKNLRSNTAAGMIAVNLSSIMNQTLSLPTAAADLNSLNVYAEAVAIFTRPDSRAQARSESPQLTNRMRGATTTMQDLINKKTPLRGNPEGVRSLFTAFGIMSAVDSWVSTAIYNTAKAKAINKLYLRGDAAIQYAESVVRRSQDMSSLLDQSLLQQSGEIGKWLTMFWSANGAMFGRMWESSQWLRQQNITKAQALGAFTWENTKLLALMTLQNDLIHGTLPWFSNDDDDEDRKSALGTLGAFSLSMLGTAWGTLPMSGGFNKRGQVDIAGLKGIEGIQDFGRTLYSMGEDVVEEGIVYMLQNNGWNLVTNASRASMILPVNFPSVGFNRAIIAVRNAVENDDTIGRTIMDSFYYNTYTSRLRNEQGLFW